MKNYILISFEYLFNSGKKLEICQQAKVFDIIVDKRTEGIEVLMQIHTNDAAKQCLQRCFRKRAVKLHRKSIGKILFVLPRIQWKCNSLTIGNRTHERRVMAINWSKDDFFSAARTLAC